MIAWVAMTLAGSLGAYAALTGVERAAPPRGTLLVNLSGAFVAGVRHRADVERDASC